MNPIIALSGWGQPYDALRTIAPDALHLDYPATSHVDAALNMLAQYRPRAVIGWSMGGQLALRAISEDVIAPARLVLIATPYQLVHTGSLKLGMGKDTYEKYRENFLRNPERTLNKSYALIAHGDVRAEALQAPLASARARMLSHDWNYWLDALGQFSYASLDWKKIPPTLLVHGDADAVVELDQSRLLHRLLPQAQLEILEGCGHAPHMHDAEKVRRVIATHIA